MNDEVNFEGHAERECDEHRTVGPHRAWCFECTEWCSQNGPYRGCELPALRAERDEERRQRETAERSRLIVVGDAKVWASERWRAVERAEASEHEVGLLREALTTLADFTISDSSAAVEMRDIARAALAGVSEAPPEPEHDCPSYLVLGRAEDGVSESAYLACGQCGALVSVNGGELAAYAAAVIEGLSPEHVPSREYRDRQWREVVDSGELGRTVSEARGEPETPRCPSCLSDKPDRLYPPCRYPDHGGPNAFHRPAVPLVPDTKPREG